MPNCKHPQPPAVEILNVWLRKRRISVPRFATMINREADMVHAWRYNRARPTLLDILAIEALTKIPARKWLDNAQRSRLATIKRENKKFTDD